MSRLPWRARTLGRLLRVHSPSAHLLGRCWCQRGRGPFAGVRREN